jgi:hypothetical protein
MIPILNDKIFSNDKKALSMDESIRTKKTVLFLSYLIFHLFVKASSSLFSMENFNDIFNGTILNSDNLLIPVSVRFWLLLIPNILSILCSIFVLYHLLFIRTLRQALNNHVIIVLLLIGLIDELITVPFILYYYRFGTTWKLTTSFSRFWTFISYLCYTTQLIGFAWASIERHILIFHNQWVSTKKKCFFVHYLPLLTILIYCFTYYFAFTLFPFCRDLNYQSPTDGIPVPCMLIDPILGKWDTICHQIIPTFIIVISSSSLLLRVLRQKTRLNRLIDWRKQRKMTIQLLFISVLYLLFNFPRTIALLFILIGLTTDSLTSFDLDIAFFAFYIVFLFPFVCCGSLPELEKKLKKLLFCRKQQRMIVPENLPMDHIRNQRTGEI